MKEENEKIMLLPLEKILPNRFQPRIKFSQESILDLADSIKIHGVIQPIIVRTIGDKYEIVAGERRYKASVIAGIKEIPAILYDINDKESAELALIENVQRKDLSPIEQAISFKKILDMGYLTQSDLANKIGISQSALANKIRLLNLSDDVQEALLDEKISERHARSLLKINNLDDQAKMLKKIISKKLTVRALDEEIKYYEEHGEIKELPENVNKSENISEPVIEIKSEEINQNNDEKVYNNISTDVQSENEKKDLVIESMNNNDEENSTSADKNEYDESVEKDNLDKSSTGEEEQKEEKTDEKNEEKIEEIKDEKIEDKREKDDNMNNFNDSYEDINYNTLKTNTGEHGKFLLNTQEDENKEEQSSSIFNFGGTQTSNSSNDLLKDLMAPQGSKNLFEKETSESVIPTNISSTPSEGLSMFEGLMNSENDDNDSVDDDTLNKFLDPSYVDGSKQNVTTSSNENNSSIFSKFINDSSSLDDSNETDKNTNSSIFNFSNSATNNITETPSIFSTGVASDVTPTNSEPSIEQKDENKSDVNNIFSGLLNTSSNDTAEPVSLNDDNQSEPIEENKLETDISNLDSINLNGNLENIFSVSNEAKPDLLAPMGTESNINSISNEPNIFEKQGSSLFDLNENKQVVQQQEESKGISLSEFNPILTPTENNEKPDLLKNDESTIIEENKSVEENNLETEIKNNVENDNTESVQPVEQENVQMSTPISFNSTSPIFITASSDTSVSAMPSTPIIDTKQEENLEPVEEQSNNIEENEVTPIEVENNNIENDSSNDMPNIIGNQPIIVTDYNKQYDPVIPDVTPKAERLEFKRILTLIRELSDTIEKCGYEIDTDEIDLQDKYQVIFNINKE